MASDHNLQQKTEQPLTYQIKLKGYLGEQWASWFESTTIKLDNDGNTLLTCLLPDQAALFGLLKKIRDAGLSLISVNYVGTAPNDRSDSHTGE